MRAGVLLHTIEEKPVSRILPHGFHTVLNSHGSETIWSTHVVFSNHISNTPWVVCGFEQPWLPLYLVQKTLLCTAMAPKSFFLMVAPHWQEVFSLGVKLRVDSDCWLQGLGWWVVQDDVVEDGCASSGFF